MSKPLPWWQGLIAASVVLGVLAWIGTHLTPPAITLSEKIEAGATPVIE